MGRALILDFGDQYAHLMARRLRELGVYSELLPVASLSIDDVLREVEKSNAIVFSGVPSSSFSEETVSLAKKVVESGKPVLAVGSSHLLLALALGGKIGPSPRSEHGPADVEILDRNDPLFKVLPSKIRVWVSHTHSVIEAPPGSVTLARSSGSPVAAFKLGRVYSLYWHPEVTHTEYGIELISKWLDTYNIDRSWKPEDVVEKIIEELKKELKGARVISAVSGGVDSTTATLLVQKVVGDSLKAIMIDHGFLPAGEPQRSLKLLRSLDINVELVDAKERFFKALKGVSDPEEKRRIFGKVYAEVLAEEAKKWGAEYLVQGTIYPDVIESGERPGASLIKTHHNVAGLPKDFKLKLIEPLKWFYKDEVRRIAKSLGVPEEIVKRQPVPGPALMVRVEGEITEERVEIVRKANAIVWEEIEKAGLADKLWQYFAVLTTSKATGVRENRRVYGYVIAIRAVESSEAMTASPARLPWDLLERIALRITSEIPSVSRVVYDVTSKPPATIEWE
ncbi:MAG: glutamine-hydrolyzing GMP synthase [Acidilobaceae archaeon]